MRCFGWNCTRPLSHPFYFGAVRYRIGLRSRGSAFALNTDKPRTCHRPPPVVSGPRQFNETVSECQCVARGTSHAATDGLCPRRSAERTGTPRGRVYKVGCGSALAPLDSLHVRVTVAASHSPHDCNAPGPQSAFGALQKLLDLPVSAASLCRVRSVHCLSLSYRFALCCSSLFSDPRGASPASSPRRSRPVASRQQCSASLARSNWPRRLRVGSASMGAP